MPLIHDSLHPIKAFFFDVDGVLSDGRILITEQGEQLRNMSVKDGYALKKAMQQGYLVAVISGGSSEGVRKRLEFLGITEIHLGIKHKLPVFEEIIQRKGLSTSEVLYMGDDIPDIPVLMAAGVAACPSDAVSEVKSICQFQTSRAGGQECVREVIEKTLKLKGQWFKI